MKPLPIGPAYASARGLVRRPEHVGRNRCVPCTILNLAIATAVTAAVALWHPGAAIAVATAMGLTIAVRGYLIPGTPTITRRYFPDRVLGWFDKFTESKNSEEVADVTAQLVDAGIVLDGGADGDIELDRAFERDLLARIDRLELIQSDADALGTLLHVDPASLALERRGDAFVAWVGDRWIGEWESRIAFVADMAANELLADRLNGWTELPLSTRSHTLGVLRFLLARCPRCGGDVIPGEDVVESCCRSIDVIATTCSTCGVRLFETEAAAADISAEA